MEKNLKNFDDLKAMGCVRKTLTIGKHQLTMRSLGYEEQSLIVATIPDTEVIGEEQVKIKDSRKYDLIQKAVLASAIEDIDGVKLSDKEKSDILGDSQTALVNLLFAQYEQLLAEQISIIDGVKKNISSLVPTP